MKEIYDALYDKLAANANIASTCTTRIFQGMGPGGAAHPLITIQFMGGGETTATPANAYNGLYLVQAVSKVSADEANLIAGYIRTALHKVTLTVNGWTNIWTSVTGQLDAVLLDSGSGQQVWQAGRLVRVARRFPPFPRRSRARAGGCRPALSADTAWLAAALARTRADPPARLKAAAIGCQQGRRRLRIHPTQDPP